ncbi:dynein regulatory complex subunit 7-like [Vespa velutina]|uniref:dynein regulatory complex subunit 7-like n=1 Tax=Vespa velutina TaxID=202808 RepID=UPI001FB1F7F9|nr:dynein regulatory complex subunit 7-like [Vespa velutina]
MIPIRLPTAISHTESIDWKRYNNGEEEEDEEERYKYEEEEDFIEVEYRPTAVPITREILQKIQQELGLIQLCWPEKDIRKDVYLSTLPDSYYSVNDKERLLLLYAENFRRQFHTKYKDRKPILLACENECGVQKFVSTSIRRSTLPYPELYTWQGCAKFVSDYISYEPLGKEDLVLVRKI